MSRVYLKSLELSGYKTINNLKSTLLDGLNIIIGKNGAGKTNFLVFLDKALNRSYESLWDYSTELNFTDKELDLRISSRQRHDRKTVDRDDLLKSIAEKINLFDLETNTNIEKHNLNNKALTEEFRALNFGYDSILIKHGLRSPNDNHIIDSPLEFNFPFQKNFTSNLLSTFIDEKKPYFLRTVAGTLYFQIINDFGDDHDDLGSRKFKEFEVEKFLEGIKLVFSQVCGVINEFIEEYLPIKEIRFNKNINFYYDDKAKEVKVENVILEFNVDGTWLPFSSLSDGTKRLFCIYADVISPKYFDLPHNMGHYNKIILIEEPELGIHPHMFHSFMGFLKDMSGLAQIIITTHSPAALDILNSNELNRIKICSRNKNGQTTLKSLTGEQKKAAKLYMSNESFLSDYWRYSDLNL